MRKTVFKIANPTRTSIGADKPVVEIEFSLEKEGDALVLYADCEGLRQCVLSIQPGEGIYINSIFDGSIDYKISEALGTVYGERAKLIN